MRHIVIHTVGLGGLAPSVLGRQHYPCLWGHQPAPENLTCSLSYAKQRRKGTVVLAWLLTTEMLWKT